MMEPLRDLPVRILRLNTRKLLMDSLNSTKVFRSDEGLCRDWRGFAHLSGVQLSNCGKNRNPMEEVLMKWAEMENATVRQLLLFLEKLDRYDVINDTEEMINEDVRLYLQASERTVVVQPAQLALCSNEQQALTVDDIYRKERGLELQMYDAVVLYDDKDWEIVQTIVNQLEKDNFKLCLKDRDIMPGVDFEHETFMTLIKERCNRVIILLSPNFLQCPFNNFLQLYAQAVSIEERQRKVIPFLYKFPSRKDVPKEFKFYTALSYDDLKRWPENFWSRLKASIATSETALVKNNFVRSELKIEELPNTEVNMQMSKEINDIEYCSRNTELCQLSGVKKSTSLSESSTNVLSCSDCCDPLKDSMASDYINENEKKRAFSKIRKLFRTLVSSKSGSGSNNGDSNSSSSSNKMSRKKSASVSKCALVAN